MGVKRGELPCEYAYGPARGLPNSRVGTFPRSLYDQAGRQGWVVISMKSDWKQVFSFERFDR
jgi:hypothetical protein